MTISSMTGYGASDGQHEAMSWRWEARSVNSKGLDIRMRLPNGFDRLEASVRTKTRTVFTRGSIQIGLTIREDSAAKPLSLNIAALDSLLQQAEPVLSDGRVKSPHLDGLLRLPGILNEEDDASVDTKPLDAALLQGLDEALQNLKTARDGEGGALAPILTGLLDEIEQLTITATASAGAQPKAIQERIRTSLSDLLADSELPDDRIATEAAMMAMKADVREELVRLEAHIESARKLLASGAPCGRKLEFTAQELHREANTLCSKSSDMELTQAGLDLKAAIDQLKEQCANVE